MNLPNHPIQVRQMKESFSNFFYIRLHLFEQIV